MWDITIHVSEDIEVLSGPKLSLANVVFFLSRSVNHTLSRLHICISLILTLIDRASTVGQSVASVLFSCKSFSHLHMVFHIAHQIVPKLDLLCHADLY